MYLVFRLCGKREIRIYGYEVDVWLGKNITLEREVYFSYMTTGRICRQSVHIFSIRNANPSPPEKRKYFPNRQRVRRDTIIRQSFKTGVKLCIKMFIRQIRVLFGLFRFLVKYFTSFFGIEPHTENTDIKGQSIERVGGGI